MPVVILIAVLAVLAAVVYVAMGRGGGMPSVERSDYAPLELGPLSATDVILHRPPAALWGYNMQATDEALACIAESIRERDIRIVALEQLVTDLSREPAPAPPVSPYAAARHARRGLGDADAGETVPDEAVPDEAVADKAVPDKAMAGLPKGAATVPVPAAHAPTEPASAVPAPAPGAAQLPLPPPIAPTAPDAPAPDPADEAGQAGQEDPDGRAPGSGAADGGTGTGMPLSAPVAEPADGAGPGGPSRASGTGWPPELSHD